MLLGKLMKCSLPYRAVEVGVQLHFGQALTERQQRRVDGRMATHVRPVTLCRCTKYSQGRPLFMRACLAATIEKDFSKFTHGDIMRDQPWPRNAVGLHEP